MKRIALRTRRQCCPLHLLVDDLFNVAGTSYHGLRSYPILHSVETKHALGVYLTTGWAVIQVLVYQCAQVDK